MAGLAGTQGEELVARYLQQKGYRLAARNYRCRFGEIDIIALCGQYIVFVEVKTRKAGALVSGAEAVGPAKRRRIISAAMLYLEEHPPRLQPRFDVAQVLLPEGGKPGGVHYLENAFVLEEGNGIF